MTLYKPEIVEFPHSFTIEPSSTDELFKDFLSTAQHLVDSIIPDPLWNDLKLGILPEILLERLKAMLPIFKVSEITDASKSLSITYLCPGKYTHQARSFVKETLSKWLIPNHLLEIAGGISLNFHFIRDPKNKFIIARDLVTIRNQKENTLIRKNLPNLINELKEKLPSEFVRNWVMNVHPIFMPRNEEEMIRTLIVLTKQIKYVRDLPQVNIHFDTQTLTELTFTVIIARLLKESMDPLRKVLEKSQLKMDVDDVRFMGYLKKKRYPKEAAVLRVTINKRTFFRPDFSVDLLKARQKISEDLKICLGKFRDFNGGMILKQEEALTHLRKLLGKLNKKEEFLLERYFYSLKPAVMQTVHSTEVLKQHFELLKETAKNLNQPYKMDSNIIDKYLIGFISSKSNSFKQDILSKFSDLKICSRNLTLSSLDENEISFFGFILRTESFQESERILLETENILKLWGKRFFCPIDLTL